MAFLFFTAQPIAQDPGQRPPPDMTGTTGRQVLVSIEGRVVAESEGANLPGVHVTLTDFRGSIRGSYDTRTGGAFGFSGLPPGRYTLTFSHPDFAEQKQTVDVVFSSHQGLVVTLYRTRRAADPPAYAVVPAWALQIPARAQKEFNKGLDALERGDAKRSITHFQAAVQTYPRFASAHGALGAAYDSTGDTKAAVAAFEKALEIDDNLFTSLLGLGTLYVSQQRYQDAEKHLVRAGMLKPDDWRVHYQLGDLYWRVQDWPQAEEKLRRAIALSGKLPRTHILLINVLAGQEKYEEALAAMENFLRLFPQDSFAPQVRQKRDLLKAEMKKTAVPQPDKRP